jgi:hypothetical protein
LLFPGTAADALWRFNPEGATGLARLGAGGIALMATVSVACGAAARGLWIRAHWGRRLAIGLLLVNLAADLASAVARGDPRTLIGLPIAGGLIAWLMRPRVQALFSRSGSPASG